MGETDARVLVRDAASVIVLRRDGDIPSVLMGQRGKTAAFMPSKFVFPGGAVDPEDAAIPMASPPAEDLAHTLSLGTTLTPETFIASATRELFEETAQVIGRKAPCDVAVPDTWRSYIATGHLPDPGAFQYIFRAITPPGRPRRFDARFFLIDAAQLASDPEDFSGAEDELSHLQWITLEDARSFDMPFITEVVLAELSARLKGTNAPGVPFFDNSGDQSRFTRL